MILNYSTSDFSFLKYCRVGHNLSWMFAEIQKFRLNVCAQCVETKAWNAIHFLLCDNCDDWNSFNCVQLLLHFSDGQITSLIPVGVLSFSAVHFNLLEERGLIIISFSESDGLQRIETLHVCSACMTVIRSICYRWLVIFWRVWKWFVLRLHLHVLFLMRRMCVYSSVSLPVAALVCVTVWHSFVKLTFHMYLYLADCI